MPRRNTNATQRRTRNRTGGSMATLTFKYSTIAVEVIGKPDPFGFVTVYDGANYSTVRSSRLTPWK
jgi:hypothetical protein